MPYEGAFTDVEMVLIVGQPPDRLVDHEANHLPTISGLKKHVLASGYNSFVRCMNIVQGMLVGLHLPRMNIAQHWPEAKKRFLHKGSLHRLC